MTSESVDYLVNFQRLQRIMGQSFHAFTQEAQEVLNLLWSVPNDQQAELLGFYLSNYDKTQKTGEKSQTSSLPQERYEFLRDRLILETVRTVQKWIFAKGISATSIAGEILAKLADYSSEEQVFVFSAILQSPLVPYKELPAGIKMDDDEFEAMKDALAKKFEHLIDIYLGHYAAITERASAILRTILEQEDEKERTVLMGGLLYAAEEKGRNELFSGIAKGLLDKLMGEH